MRPFAKSPFRPRLTTVTLPVVAISAALFSSAGLTGCSSKKVANGVSDVSQTMVSTGVSSGSGKNSSASTASASSTSAGTRTTSVPAPHRSADVPPPQVWEPQVRPGGTPRIGDACPNLQGEIATGANGQKLICNDLGTATVWSVLPDDSQWTTPLPNQPANPEQPGESTAPENPPAPTETEPPAPSENPEPSTPGESSDPHPPEPAKPPVRGIPFL